jgi:hypothetical protein
MRYGLFKIGIIIGGSHEDVNKFCETVKRYRKIRYKVYFKSYPQFQSFPFSLSFSIFSNYATILMSQKELESKKFRFLKKKLKT